MGGPDDSPAGDRRIAGAPQLTQGELWIVPFGQVTLIQTARGKIAPLKSAPAKLELMITTEPSDAFVNFASLRAEIWIELACMKAEVKSAPFSSALLRFDE
jgi:hypothetical protein